MEEITQKNDVTEETVSEETIPQPDTAPSVTVKFNKEKRNLPLDEAAVLAQKGLKYELIEDDFKRLKNIAAKSGKSISEFIGQLERNICESRKKELLEQTGGNEGLADYVMSLEGVAETDCDFSELQKMFPEIKQIGELPEEVTKAAEISGKTLLDSYLRYLFEEKRKSEESEKHYKALQKSGVGSLKNGSVPSGEGALNREFLKGLWGK